MIWEVGEVPRARARITPLIGSTSPEGDHPSEVDESLVNAPTSKEAVTEMVLRPLLL